MDAVRTSCGSYMDAVRTLCGSCMDAVRTLCGNCMDAVRTSCGRCMDAVRTSCGSCMDVLERCLEAVEDTFDILGIFRSHCGITELYGRCENFVWKLYGRIRTLSGSCSGYI